VIVAAIGGRIADAVPLIPAQAGIQQVD